MAKRAARPGRLSTSRHEACARGLRGVVTLLWYDICVPAHSAARAHHLHFYDTFYTLRMRRISRLGQRPIPHHAKNHLAGVQAIPAIAAICPK